MPFLNPIPLHNTSLFKFENVHYDKNCKYVKSYYHHLNDFLPYHTHDFYEINIVYSGVGIHKLEKREILDGVIVETVKNSNTDTLVTKI